MKSSLCLALAALLAVSPARADPPAGTPLPGTRVGGEGHDERAAKRLPTRLPTRLDTRITPQTFGQPLVAATSQITADKENGCARGGDSGTRQACGKPH